MRPVAIVDYGVGNLRSAQKAFERYASEGQGELHDVMAQIAKADVAFRFLLEVRNKLTEAYQEVARIPV